MYKDLSELPPLLVEYLLYNQTVKNRSSLTVDEILPRFMLISPVYAYIKK